MKAVFVDTNVILDVLLQNDGFWQDSLEIFQYAERKEIQAYVSASSMTDIFYVAKKKLTTPVARVAMENLLDLFAIVGIDESDLRGALSLPLADMEDALQVWCAMKANCDELITRDIGGFENVDISLVTPTEFVV